MNVVIVLETLRKKVYLQMVPLENPIKMKERRIMKELRLKRKLKVAEEEIPKMVERVNWKGLQTSMEMMKMEDWRDV